MSVEWRSQVNSWILDDSSILLFHGISHVEPVQDRESYE